jgi:hypothetical protein
VEDYSCYPQNGAFPVVWEGNGGHVIKTGVNEYAAYYGSRFLGSENSLELARWLVVIEDEPEANSEIR